MSAGKYKRESIAWFGRDKQGKWYWRLQAANNRIVAVGTHTHGGLVAAQNELQKVATGRSMYSWHTYTDKAGKWRWRAEHRRTKDVVCGSHEAFSSLWSAGVALRAPYRILAEWEDGKVRNIVDNDY